MLGGWSTHFKSCAIVKSISVKNSKHLGNHPPHTWGSRIPVANEALNRDSMSSWWWLITGIPNWTPRFYLCLPKSYQVTFELQQGRLYLGGGLGLFRRTYCAGCVWISGPMGQILAERLEGRKTHPNSGPFGRSLCRVNGQHRKNLSIKRTSTPGPTKILPKHPLGVQIPFGRNLRNLDLLQVIGKHIPQRVFFFNGDSPW